MSARRLSIDSKMTLESLGNPGGVGGRAGTHPAAASPTPLGPAGRPAPPGLGAPGVAAGAAGAPAARAGAARQIDRARPSSQRAGEPANVGTNRGTPDGGSSGVHRD